MSCFLQSELIKGFTGFKRESTNNPSKKLRSAIKDGRPTDACASRIGRGGNDAAFSFQGGSLIGMCSAEFDSRALSKERMQVRVSRVLSKASVLLN